MDRATCVALALFAAVAAGGTSWFFTERHWDSLYNAQHYAARGSLLRDDLRLLSSFRNYNGELPFKEFYECALQDKYSVAQKARDVWVDEKVASDKIKREVKAKLADDLKNMDVYWKENPDDRCRENG